MLLSLLLCSVMVCGVWSFDELDNSSILPEGKRRRFEYQYSFKGPHLMQSDGSVPFWKTNGVAAAGEDKVRLVPSMRGMKGGIWSSNPFPHESWEVVIKFDVKGRTKMGADGMAFWYVNQALASGDTFGSQGTFVGLGVFLDSFDNNGNGDNPCVTVFVNDGSQLFEHESDGLNQKLGGCRFNFRNNAYPTKLKIVYQQQILKVFRSLGYSPDFPYESCAVMENVILPANYTFGLSAATGAVADDHDVLSFVTWSILDVPEDAGLSPEENQQQEEYNKNVEEFNKMHEDYKEQHPDQGIRQPLLEEISGPGLQAIFDIQSNVHTDVRSIHSLMLSLQQQQQTVTNLLQQMDARSSTTTQQQRVPPSGGDDNAKNYHIENVMNLQREVIDSLNVLRSTMDTVQSSIIAVSQQVSSSKGTGQQQATGGAGDQYAMQQVQRQLAAVQGDLQALANKKQPTPQLRCPEPEMPNCSSIPAVVLIAIVQIIILVIYHQIKSSRENAAKKFF